jgi:hypothetical protein
MVDGVAPTQRVLATEPFNTRRAQVPDFDRAGRIGDFYGDLRALTFGQLLIDSRSRSRRGRSYFANFGSGSYGDD